MHYFAYGSNMYTPRLRARVPSCVAVSVAILTDHSLRFHKRSVDGSGKCNALYTGSPKDEVLGVLFDIEESQRWALDAAEGLGLGYDERRIKVISPSGLFSAYMYQANAGWIDDTLRPYGWYLDLVIAGAREHRLAEHYVRSLLAWPALTDPDGARESRNRRLLAGD